MTDFTAQSGHADGAFAAIRTAFAALAAFPASFGAANAVANAFERGERPSARDLETLGLPADVFDRAA